MQNAHMAKREYFSRQSVKVQTTNKGALTLDPFRKSTLGLAAIALCLAPLASGHASGIDDLEDEFEFDEPDIEEPVIDEPEMEEPLVEEPEIEEPEIEEPEIAEPEVEEPETEEPEIDEPEIEEPETEEPEAEEPDVDEPEAVEPDTDEPEDQSDDSDVDEPDDSDVEETDSDDAVEDDSDFDNSGHGNSEDDAPDDNASNEGSGSSGSSEDNSSNEGSGNEQSASEAQQASDWLADLTQSQNPEFDDDGNPVRRGELIALDLSPEGRDRLESQGFVPVEVSLMPALSAELTTLRVPEGQTATAALAMARALDPAGIYDLGHYYSTPYETSTGPGMAAAPPASARNVAGNLRIGLIDTDIRRTNLPSRVDVESRAFGDASTQGNADHGTAVAAILVAHGAGELLVANVFDNDGRRDFTSAQTIGEALAWLMATHVDVVNVSLAGPRNAVLDALVRRADARGTVIVAAAGNGGPAARPAYPAALPEVVAVTAVDGNQRIYRYANQGAYIRLATYGVQVPVMLADGTRSVFTGTSFAAPRVSARLAACIANGGRRETCISRLESGAQDLGAPGRDAVYGFGFVE